MTAFLGPDRVADYERDGFLVLPGFASRETCEAMIARSRELVAAFDPGTVASVFSTKEQTHTTDDYFLSSGGEVRFFFEEEAFDGDGRLRQAKELSINKIGHALHDRDPLFSEVSRDPRLAGVCADLGMRDPLLMQSMYIFKQPRIGGEVVCHQDSTFLWTEPESCVGLWLAVEDATTENGCMWALPGRHRDPLKSRFRRAPGGGVAMDVLDASPWPSEGEVPLEAEQGTLIVLHGRLPHRSGPNRSDRSRHAYTLHVVDGACDYPADNWLQRDPADPARGF
jgi:phytanoyl-CoA hydroxylase